MKKKSFIAGYKKKKIDIIKKGVVKNVEENEQYCKEKKSYYKKLIKIKLAASQKQLYHNDSCINVEKRKLYQKNYRIAKNRERKTKLRIDSRRITAEFQNEPYQKW